MVTGGPDQPTDKNRRPLFPSGADFSKLSQPIAIIKIFFQAG
jgi:hypothetical protein